MRFRRKMLLVYVACVVVVVVLFVAILSVLQPRKNKVEIRSLPRRYIDQMMTDRPANKDKPSGYLIYSAGCRIPNQADSDETRERLLNGTNYASLERHRRVSYVSKSTIKINETSLRRLVEGQGVDFNDVSCCYRPVRRGTGRRADFKIRLDKMCIPFKYNVRVSNEVVQVECRQNRRGQASRRILYKQSHAIIKRKRGRLYRKWTKHDRHLSVAIVGIDGTSAQNFHRFMKTSEEWLRNSSAFRFQGFNSIGENTFPNLMPLLTGLTSGEVDRVCRRNGSYFFDGCAFLWDKFQELGFVTAYIDDYPDLNLFASRGGFVRSPTDYYFRHMYIANKDGTFGKKHHRKWAPIEAEVSVDLTLRLLRQCRRHKYFSLTWLNTLTHGNMTDALLLDTILAESLNKMSSERLLDNTLLVLMSDHGARYGNFRQTVDGWSEARLPFLYLLFPKWFLDRYRKIRRRLEMATDQLITTHDLHETLKHVLFHEDYRLYPGRFVDDYEDDVTSEGGRPRYKLYDKFALRGVSLFKVQPANRTCQGASIPRSSCSCYNVHQISPTSDVVENVREPLLKFVNDVAKARRDSCVFLEFGNLIDVRIMVPNDSSDEYNVIKETRRRLSNVRYMVVFTTKPGDAVFEGSFELDPSNNVPFKIDVQRVSQLNPKSVRCVDRPRDKLFCHCKDAVTKDDFG